jgi:integrase/recombinase XerD
MSNFIHFRNAVAILTIYKCGLRISMLIQLEEKHVDFNNQMLIIEGDIMKGREVLKLPFDDELEMYLKRLIKQNDVICNYYIFLLVNLETR